MILRQSWESGKVLLCYGFVKPILLMLELEANGLYIYQILLYPSEFLLEQVDVCSPVLWASVVIFLLLNVSGKLLLQTYISKLMLSNFQIQNSIGFHRVISSLSGWQALFWVSIVPLIVSNYYATPFDHHQHYFSLTREET